jgi:hypothetical protein
LVRERTVDVADEGTDEFTAAMNQSGAPRIDALGAIGRRQVERAIRYYERGVVGKRTAAKFLRVTALILGVMASLVPLVISLIFSVWWPESSKAKDWITLSAIFAIVAIGLVAVDRLFGSSSSWIRFITATLDLQARRSTFLVGWSKLRINAAVSDEAHLLAALQYLEVFIAEIDAIVRSETQAWVIEFRGALDQLDKRIEAQRLEHASTAISERVGVEVTRGADQLTPLPPRQPQRG